MQNYSTGEITDYQTQINPLYSLNMRGPAFRHLHAAHVGILSDTAITIDQVAHLIELKRLLASCEYKLLSCIKSLEAMGLDEGSDSK